MTLVYIFPGQSSRYPGMLNKLAGINRTCGLLLSEASEILGRDLSSHYREDNPEVFAHNVDVQIGVFLANHMFLQIIEEGNISADVSLGLSLGEYNHLVHIGALSFDDALLTVQQRGRAYDAGPRGAMASVFPIDLLELQEVCQRVQNKGVLEVTNLNSPRQQVLSGEFAALEAAMAILEEEFYVDARIIERQVPMHCSIFAPVGEAFRRHLEGVTFHKPRLPYLPNALGQLLEQPTQKDFVELLSTHVHRPVLWRKSIDLVLQRWPDAMFVEVGPMSVLYNLLNKKWHKFRKVHTDSADNTDEHLRLVISELRGVARTLEFDIPEQ